MRQTFFAILLMVILISSGFVWFKYIRSPSPEKLPGSAGLLSERDDEKRISQYRRIKNLKPDTGIFSDPLFKALRPASGKISNPEEPAEPPVKGGRANPFAF